MARYEIIMDVDDPRFERAFVDAAEVETVPGTGYDDGVLTMYDESNVVVFSALLEDVLYVKRIEDEEDEDAEAPSLDAG